MTEETKKVETVDNENVATETDYNVQPADGQEVKPAEENPFVWSLNTLFGAAETANKRGVFNLTEAALVHQAMMFIKDSFENGSIQYQAN